MGKSISLKTMKAQPILKTIGEIEIYNINAKVNDDRRIQITEYVIELLKDKPEDKDFEILGKEVIVKVLPILTNILLDELNDEEIDEILAEPSDELLEVVNVCNKIVTDVISYLEKLMNLPKEQLEKLNPQTKKDKLLDERRKFEEDRKQAEKQAIIDAKKADLLAQIKALEEGNIEVAETIGLPDMTDADIVANYADSLPVGE